MKQNKLLWAAYFVLAVLVFGPSIAGRNGSGTYAIPNTFTPGTTITASGFNQNFADIATEITNSIAADGQTTITGALKGANGSASAPSYGFNSDADTGMYRAGNDNLGLAAGGTKVVDVTSTGAAVTGTLSVSGEVTLTTGLGTTSIADAAVTYAKIQDVSAASKLIGRGSANGSGDAEEITVGAGLQMSGTTLSSTITQIVGQHRGLVVKNNASTPDSQVDVEAQSIILYDGTDYFQATSVDLTINGATTGANALDTGSLQASTWYAVWVIYNGSDVAGLLSTSATSPTMPNGYTYKARVGWMRTDGSVDFRRILQKGKRAQYVVASGSPTSALPQAASGVAGDSATPTWVEVSLTSYIPSTATVVHGVANRAGTAAIIIAPNSAYGGRASTTNPPPVVSFQTDGVGNIPFSFNLESTSIYWAASGTSSIGILGWEDDI